MNAFNKFRRILLCLAFALFLGLPIALATLSVIGPSSLVIVLLVVGIFMIGGGIGGYALAKRIEKSVVQRIGESANNAELYQAREKRMEMITRAVYALIAVWICYDVIFSHNAAPSIFEILIDLVLAIIFLFLFLFYDKSKSPWTKKFYLAMVTSCIVYLVVGLVNFSIVEQQRPVSILLTSVNTQESMTTPSVATSTTSTSSNEQMGTHIFKIKELGLEMTVPNDLDLTYVVSVQSGSGTNSAGAYLSTTTNAFFSSYSLINLVKQLDPQHMNCGQAADQALGVIGIDDMTPRSFVASNEKLVGDSYVYGVFTSPDHPCSNNQQIQALVAKQSGELSAAYNIIQAY